MTGNYKGIVYTADMIAQEAIELEIERNKKEKKVKNQKTMMQFKEAIRSPQNGMIDMSDDNYLAIVCRSIAGKYCLRESSLFDWAVKHGYSYLDLIDADIMNKNFMLALINDSDL